MSNVTGKSEASSLIDQSEKNTLMIEYDSRENALYRIDGSNEIWKIGLDNKEKTVVYELPAAYLDGSIENIALDWITKNLYFFHEGDLKVLNLKNSTRGPKILIPFHYFYPATVKVFPKEGYLIVKSFSKSN